MSEHPVVREGSVGRAVFQSNQWKKMRKSAGKTPPNMPPEIFLDGKSLNKISVHILGDNREEVAGRCDDIAKQRGANRSFYGWAEVAVVFASQDGRAVLASPMPEDRWHADIVLPCEPSDRDAREWHAEELAAYAVCCPRP